MVVDVESCALKELEGFPPLAVGPWGRLPSRLVLHSFDSPSLPKEGGLSAYKCDGRVQVEPGAPGGQAEDDVIRVFICTGAAHRSNELPMVLVVFEAAVSMVLIGSHA